MCTSSAFPQKYQIQRMRIEQKRMTQKSANVNAGSTLYSVQSMLNLILCTTWCLVDIANIYKGIWNLNVIFPTICVCNPDTIVHVLNIIFTSTSLVTASSKIFCFSRTKLNDCPVKNILLTSSWSLKSICNLPRNCMVNTVTHLWE